MILPQANVPESALTFLERTRQWLTKHPLLLRYLQHRQSSFAYDSQAWQAYGSWLYAMYSVVNWRALGLQLPKAEDPLLSDDEVATFLVIRLSRAQVFLWRRHIEGVVAQAPLPSEVHLNHHLCMYPDMFFCHEGRGFDTKRRITSMWSLVSQDKTGINIFHQTANIDNAVCKVSNGLRMPFGSKWPSEFTGDRLAEVESYLKYLAFLMTPCVDKGFEKLPRRMCRGVAKHEASIAAKPTHNKLIGVVELRRKRVLPREDSGEAQAVEWKGRWWVGAHYHNYWCPSTNEYKLLFVDRYVKGPPGMPFLEKVYDVSR